MRRTKKLNSILAGHWLFLGMAVLLAAPLWAQQNDDALLRVREQVWRAWFAGDTKTIERLVPAETIVMSGGETQWKRRADILQSAAEFHSGGGNLLRLEFPHTEVQHFGNVAIVWSTYIVEVEENGKRTVSHGRSDEIFVWQHGHWTNPGWHTEKTE